MQIPTYSRKFLLQRRFYTVLPLLVVPFVTILFYILIGKKLGKDSAPTEGHTGLITKLPDAILKNDDAFNKLSYYKKAAADSARLRDLIAKDPYYQDTIASSRDTLWGIPLKSLEGSRGKSKGGQGGRNSNTDIQSQERQMQAKLAELDKALTQPAHPGTGSKKAERVSVNEETGADQEIAQLQKLMAGLDAGNARPGSDPELTELNNMLDKILEIQDPEKATEKLRTESLAHRKQVFPILKVGGTDPITTLEAAYLNRDSASANAVSPQSAGFYSLDDERAASSGQNAIEASIDQTQKLVTGATIKLRLANDIFIAGVQIPAGLPVFGAVSLNGERLLVHIQSLRNENDVFPVNLSVYDADGVEGIYIPGAISRDVGKQSADRAVQGLSIPITDPSIGAQAASAGIQAAKTLLGRKVKLVQVTVKAGYRILLIDNNSRSN